MSLVTCASIEKEYEKLNNVKRDDIQNLMAWLKGVAHLPHEFITGNILPIRNYCDKYCNYDYVFSS